MSTSSQPRQHGVKGAYVGGDWCDMEDLGSQFLIKGGSHTTNKCLGDGGKDSCKTCPRSRTRNVAAKADGTYDVIIIGAGCIGAAIARELSKTLTSVLVLESADDISNGATKGNSGIVHAGFDDAPGSVRAKFCWKGNQMFPQLDRELHFGYQKNGSLVLARSKEDYEHLKELKKRGEINGVERLRIVEREELFQMEPHCHPDSIAALYSPDAGNLIPYEYTIALAENAVDNGAELRIRRMVTSITYDADAALFSVNADHWEPAEYVENKEFAFMKFDDLQLGVLFASVAYYALGRFEAQVRALLPPLALGGLSRKQLVMGGTILLEVLLLLLFSAVRYYLHESTRGRPVKTSGKGRKVTVDEMKIGGSGSHSAMNGKSVELETFKARYVVNAAGGYSDKIAAMIGDDSFKIKLRLGDYVLLKREQGHLARHTLFPCPGPLGKGVLVQTTLWGNLILGPTARDIHLPEVMAETSTDIQSFIFQRCKELVPTFDCKEAFHAFCGARAKSTAGDWIIRPSERNGRFILAAGIDSPGLAGSPAVALEVVRLLGAAGLQMKENPDFNPNRAPIIVPKDGWKGLRAGPPGKVTNPKENVVCKCEKVTEEEVVTALHRSLPIDSTQAIRKRTRAGMGHCQGDEGNYDCECRVAEIIARETRTDASVAGRRPFPATSSLPRRWLDDADRQRLVALKG